MLPLECPNLAYFKCVKTVSLWDCAADPVGRVYTVFPDPLAGFRVASILGAGRGSRRRGKIEDMTVPT
jgi:hypothetical protein